MNIARRMALTTILIAALEGCGLGTIGNTSSNAVNASDPMAPATQTNASSSTSANNGATSTGANTQANDGATTPSNGSDASTESTPSTASCETLPTDAKLTFGAKITLTSAAATLLPGQAIHVHALDSLFTGGDDALHSHIAWDFGDASGTYDCLVGFNAAHIYDTPGSYVVTLTITTPSGAIGQAKLPVTVSADTRKTLYVAANGDDTNPGTSPNLPLKTLDKVQSIFATSPNDLVVLFNRGDTFQLTDSTQPLALQNATDSALGAYGSASSNPPLLTSTAYNTIGMGSGAKGITIADLAIQGSTRTTTDCVIPNGDAIVLRHLAMSSSDSAVHLNMNPTNVVIQDSTTTLSGYGVWIQGSDVALLGNTFEGSGGQHNVRGGATRILIAKNTMHEGSNLGSIEIDSGDYTYVFDNYVEGPTDKPTTIIGFGQIGIGSPTATCMNLIAEGNVLTNANFAISSSATGAILRNNLVQGSLLNPGPGIEITVDNTEFKTLPNLEIVNNTVVNASTLGWGDFFGLNMGSSGVLENFKLSRNLYVAPFLNQQPAACLNLFGSASSSSTLLGFSEFQDNVWSVPMLSTSLQFSLAGTTLTLAQVEGLPLGMGGIPARNALMAASLDVVEHPLTQWVAGDYSIVGSDGVTIGAKITP